MRFIHSADWQIGKPFRNFGELEPVLRQARLTAIENIGRLAQAEGVSHVLVAGDLYDTEAPTPKTLLEPLERMRRFSALRWHVISGNHDPHRGNGLWDRVRAMGPPANVELHLEPTLVALGEEAVLLPAPMRRKSEASDLTAWMDGQATAPGLLRVGLAHGSVTGFDAAGEANNPIAPDRARRAGLDYLALGDWHRTMRIDDRTWYAGTPEADRFNSQETGQVLLVDIAGPGAPPRVTPRRTGTCHWWAVADDVSDAADLDIIEARLRGLPEPSASLVRLTVRGHLPLAGHRDLERRMSALAASLLHLDLRTEALQVRPTLADLEAIDFGGVLREAADDLKFRSEDETTTIAERRRAGNALIELFLMTAGPAEGGA
jgi:DNA repair exonuclease SbcCD nuclease subunit